MESKTEAHRVNSDTPENSPVCPVTGMPVRREPGWIRVGRGGNYSISLSTIGEHIILSRSKGYVTGSDKEMVMALFKEVIDEAFDKDRPYIHISDFSGLRGSSFAARKNYIDFLKIQDRILSLIFYGVSPSIEMALRLIKRVTSLKYDIHIARDYAEAMTIAMARLQNIQPPHAHRDWRLQLDGFSTRFKILDGNIIHALTEGYLREEHVAPLHHLREKVIDAVHSADGTFYMIANTGRVSGGSRVARRRLMESLIDVHRKRPIGMYVIYGANWFMRTAMQISKPFLPFKVAAAASLEEGLQLIKNEATGVPQSHAPETPEIRTPDNKHKASEIQGYADELIRFIGSIHWDREGIDVQQRDRDHAHPFSSVFEAIVFIKGELDDHFGERKKAEEALRESEEKYRKIIQSIQDGYYEVDLKGNFTFVNDSMSRILGYSLKELIGLNYRNYMDGETAQNVYRIFNRVYRTGNPDEGFDWEFTSKDGSKKHVETSLSLMRNPDGLPVGFRGILRDITLRKRAELAIREAHEELEKRVRERTHELAEANERLRKEISEKENAQREALRAKDAAEKADRAKSEFLANMSHELRTPLNHIIGFTELIVDKNFGELTEAQEEYLQDVLQSSRHLLSLINDILDLSKVEAGRLEFCPTDVELEFLLENSLTLVKEKAMKHNISISLEIGGIPNQIEADERKLKQIMYNLLSNAVKFTPDGGEIHIQAALLTGADSGPWALSGRSSGDFLEISVADSGIGINPDHLERIFKPFEQADISISSKYHGTGLGLSLTKSLVEMHNGMIRAESDGEGKGAKFTFIIPLHGASCQS